MKQVWLSLCVAGAGLLAVAIWTGSRTTSVYAGAALQQARGLREQQALLRSYEHEMATIRSTLSETTLCAIAILVLLLIAIAMIWIADPATSEQRHSASDHDALTRDR